MPAPKVASNGLAQLSAISLDSLTAHQLIAAIRRRHPHGFFRVIREQPFLTGWEAFLTAGFVPGEADVAPGDFVGLGHVKQMLRRARDCCCTRLARVNRNAS